MSDQTTIPADETPVAAPAAVEAPAATPAPVPVAVPTPAHVRPHPRPWVMVVCAVVAAFLFMSIGACAALGIARHAIGGGLRGGAMMSAPGGMRGFDGRGGRGFDQGGVQRQGRGYGGNRGGNLAPAPGQDPSQDTSSTY